MISKDGVLRRLRALCLSLPETSEVSSWGHPNFRAGRKTFVTFEAVRGRASVAFRLSHTDIDLLLRREQFFATPYGQGQWVSVWADGAMDWGLVRKLVENAYRQVALKRMIAVLDAKRVARRAR